MKNGNIFSTFVCAMPLVHSDERFGPQNVSTAKRQPELRVKPPGNKKQQRGASPPVLGLRDQTHAGAGGCKVDHFSRNFPHVIGLFRAFIRTLVFLRRCLWKNNCSVEPLHQKKMVPAPGPIKFPGNCWPSTLASWGLKVRLKQLWAISLKWRWATVVVN